MLTFIKPKCDIRHATGVMFKKDKIYYPGPAELLFMKQYEKEIVPNLKLFHIDDMIRNFDEQNSEKVDKVLMFRNGGAGDMFALSGMCAYLDKYSQEFYTLQKYFPSFKWFERKVNVLKDARSIIWNTLSPTDRLRFSTHRRVVFEGEIENGLHKNWMDVFYEQINATNVPNEFKRPRLVKDRITTDKSRIIPSDKKNILYCPKSTAQMRSTTLKELHEPMKELGIYANFYIHQDNLTTFRGGNFIESHEGYAKENNIKVIRAKDLGEYLLDVYDVDLVVSVDSTPIHFREGVEKPYIGLYNAFTSKSRTEYYKFGSCYDIKSTCQYQPCFLHEKNFGDVCHQATKDMVNAPCMTKEHNKLWFDCLIDIYSKHLK